MRRNLAILMLIFVSTNIVATPQDAEILIYEDDTMFMDVFPLEILMEQNKDVRKKIMHASLCSETSCLRAHRGTWKIVNDSLFLVKLMDACNEKELAISLFFDTSQISSTGVFAYWFSNTLKLNYGKYLKFDLSSWTNLYEGSFACDIKNGIVSDINIQMKPPSYIDSIRREEFLRKDTIIHLFVDDYPILITDNKEYTKDEISDFILSHVHYAKDSIKTGNIGIVVFIIEKDGSVGNKQFYSKVNINKYNEFMHVFNTMTKWKPGLNKR